MVVSTWKKLKKKREIQAWAHWRRLLVECEISRRPRLLACTSPFIPRFVSSREYASSDSPLGTHRSILPPSCPVPLSRCPLSILVAYKLTAGTDSAVSTVFHVIRSRIIYLTTLCARSRNFYCFVTPGGTDGRGTRCKKTRLRRRCHRSARCFACAHPFGILGWSRPRGWRGCCWFAVNLEMITRDTASWITLP